MEMIIELNLNLKEYAIIVLILDNVGLVIDANTDTSIVPLLWNLILEQETVLIPAIITQVGLDLCILLKMPILIVNLPG